MNSSNKALTVREAFHQASSFLQQNESTQDHEVKQDVGRVCEWMLLHLLGWNRSQFFLQWDNTFPSEKLEEWHRMLARKAAGEPVQYIIGEQEFYGLAFQVNPAVLIPRPETEILVEQLIKEGRQIWPSGSPLVVDVGTGSGAIPVTLAVQCPGWRINASDISSTALQVANQNARLHQVEERIQFFEGSLLEPFMNAGISPDILVSNPPYIPSSDMLHLQPEVRQHEPSLALDGGINGLVFYKQMMEQMQHLPAYPRLVGFEVGQGQARQVAVMLQSYNQWKDIRIIEDLSGIERHVIGIGYS